jgi:DNA repair exonuclease SbcCD ATPase subunit
LKGAVLNQENDRIGPAFAEPTAMRAFWRLEDGSGEGRRPLVTRLRREGAPPWMKALKREPSGQERVRGTPMPSNVERTTTVSSSRSVRTEGADTLKRNLGNIASEIERVRAKAREEAASLEKIKGMLDVGYLNDLIRSIEELEVRMETLQRESLTAGAEVDQVRGDLAREQDRLAKLWTAYKSLEDELERTKRDGPALAQRLAERERQLESLRQELSRLGGLEQFKSNYEAASRENQTLRIEVENLNREGRRMADQMRAAETEMMQLRSDAGSKARVEELEHTLDAERERLAKLYKVYEEQVAEVKKSRARLDAWEDWYQSVLPAMETLCRQASTAPRA